MQWFCLKILPCRIHGLQSRAISRRYSLQIARSGGTPAVCLVPLYLIVVVLSLSRVWLFATPWTVARQAPLSVGFSTQEDCSRLPCPPPGDLPDSGIKPTQVSHIPGRSCFFFFNCLSYLGRNGYLLFHISGKQDQLSKPSAGWVGFFFNMQ